VHGEKISFVTTSRESVRSGIPPHIGTVATELTQLRASTSTSGLAYVWHDKTCPACDSKSRQLLLGARSTTLGAITIEQSWASPFNDDKKLIAFSDSVQDAAHRSGFFTARTYLNTVRTGLAQVIDQVARPRCDWNTFLEGCQQVWSDEDSPLAMPVERFVSEFIGPNMMWQRDWAQDLQENNALKIGSKLPGRVQKRFAWQAFAEFTYLSRRGRTLNAIGKATLAPRIEDISRVAVAIVPVLQESFGIRQADQSNVLHWLWGFVCHLRQRGAVTHPEMVNFAADGNLYAFTRTAGRKEWLPGLGEHTPHPVFLTLGNDNVLRARRCMYLNHHLVMPAFGAVARSHLQMTTLRAESLLDSVAEGVRQPRPGIQPQDFRLTDKPGAVNLVKIRGDFALTC
jgi:DEAD/DEAH box helicase domain-containing protein